MRNPKNFARPRKPCIVVVCHDRTTRDPQFCLTNYALGPDDIDQVRFNDLLVPVKGFLDQVEISSTKPTGQSGLIRSTGSMSIKADGPFADLSWARELYSAGANADSFYFSAWAMGSMDPTVNITDGMFYGLFKIDSGVDWKETDTTVTVSLIDYILSLDSKINTYSDSSVEALANTDLEILTSLPIYIGNFTHAKAYGSQSLSTLASVGVGAVLAQYKGTVVTASPTVVNLGASDFLAGNVGNVVKIRVEENLEIITGTVVDNMDGSFSLHTITHDDKWDTLTFDAYKKNGPPVDAALSAIAVTITEDVTRIPFNGMYFKVPTLNFFTNPDSGAVSDKVCRISGILDYGNKVWSVDPIEDPTYPLYRTNVGLDYAHTATNSAFTGTIDEHFNYAEASSAQTCNIYFRDVSITIEDTVPGNTWVALITQTINNANATFLDTKAYYIRNLGATIPSVGGVACSKDGKVTPIPTSAYSILYDQTFNGIDKLTKITINKDLLSLFKTYDTNGDIVIPNIDLSFMLVTMEQSIKIDEFVNILINELAPEEADLFAKQLALPDPLFGGPGISAIISTDDSISSVLDTALYEAGHTLKWKVDGPLHNLSFYINDYVSENYRFVYWTTDDVLYAKPIVNNSISDFDILEGSFSVSIGKLATQLVPGAEQGEFTNTWFKASYNNDLFTNKATYLKSALARGKKDNYQEFKLNHITDGDSAIDAIRRMTRGGHFCAFNETTRRFTMMLTLDKANIEAGDIIDLHNLRHVSDSAKAPLFKNDAGDFYYQYDYDYPYVLLPNIVVVESIKHDGDQNITVQVRQVQLAVRDNVTFVIQNEDITPPFSSDDVNPADPDNPSGPDNPDITKVGPFPTVCIRVATYPPPELPPSPAVPNKACGPAIVVCDSGGSDTDPSADTSPKTPKYYDACTEEPRDFSAVVRAYGKKSSYTITSPTLEVNLLCDLIAIIGCCQPVSFLIDDDFSFITGIISGRRLTTMTSTGLSGGGTPTKVGKDLSTVNVAASLWHPEEGGQSLSIAVWFEYEYVANLISGEIVKFPCSASVSVEPGPVLPITVSIEEA